MPTRRRVARIIGLGHFVLFAASGAYGQSAAVAPRAATAARAAQAARAQAAAAPLERQALPVKRADLQQALHGAQRLHLLSGGQSVAIDPAATSIRAFPGDLVYGSTGAGVAVHTTQDGRSVWQLPWRIWPVSADGSLGERLRIDVEIEGVGLSYVKATDAFAGTIQLGVIDEAHPSGSNALSAPVRLSLIATVDSLDPASLSIPHTSIPFTVVHLVAREPGDSVTVRIRTDFDTMTLAVPVPVSRPRLRLRATPTRINGYGLESTDLLVILGGPPSRDSVSVTLTATAGHFEEEQVRLLPGAVAKAVLWSRGVGSSTITAETLDQFRDSLAVDFKFPWLFLAAVLIGGAVGSVIRQGYQAIKGQWPPVSTFIKEMAIGVLAGGLVAVMQSVGVNVLKVAPKGGSEAAVGVIAAVGAVLGSALIDLIKGSFGGGNGGS